MPASECAANPFGADTPVNAGQDPFGRNTGSGHRRPKSETATLRQSGSRSRRFCVHEPDVRIGHSTYRKAGGRLKYETPNDVLIRHRRRLDSGYSCTTFRLSCLFGRSRPNRECLDPFRLQFLAFRFLRLISCSSGGKPMTFYHVLSAILFFGAFRELLRAIDSGDPDHFWMAAIVALFVFSDAIFTSWVIEQQHRDYRPALMFIDLINFGILSAVLISLNSGEHNLFEVALPRIGSWVSEPRAWLLLGS